MKYSEAFEVLWDLQSLLCCKFSAEFVNEKNENRSIFDAINVRNFLASFLRILSMSDVCKLWCLYN